MSFDDITEAVPTESRQQALLEAAVGVFARFGFRKTSMDEVARAAGVSRQGLYLQFADKEALFRQAVEYKLSRQLRTASAALADTRRGVEDRLIAACDEWAGKFVGVRETDAADLMCASTSLAGGTLAYYEAQFEQALARAIDSSPLARACADAGLSPADAARVLHATARGLKLSCKSRPEFVQGISAAARLFCAPLNPRPAHLE